MGHLIQLDVENFKSYKGKQTLGPFYNFTAVIGPNGSGKSNLMDAISFVLGVKSSHLRSTQLRDLIYRAAGDNSDKNMPLESDSAEPHFNRNAASVTAIYETSQGNQIQFTRIIHSNGSSDYRLEGHTVTYQKYLAALKKENILVKARNFLVFQGDVEAVASQSPKDLTRLIEQISGSIELKDEYDRLKNELEIATEASAQNFSRKRNVNAEMKQFKEQKQEAERFEKLQESKDKLVQTLALWKLFHLDKHAETQQDLLVIDHRVVADADTQHVEIKSRLKGQVKALAKSQKDVIRLERNAKQLQQKLDDLKPDLLRVDEQIRHCTKKQKIAMKNKDETEVELLNQSELVNMLKEDFGKLTRALDQFEEKVRATKKQSKSLGTLQLQEYKQMRTKVDTQLFAERQSLSLLKVQLQTANEASKRLQEGLEELQTKESMLLNDQKIHTQRKEKITAQLGQVDDELKASKKCLLDMDTDLRRLNQIEGEITEKLSEISSRLLQERADRHESERNKKFRDTLETLKRLFPGVHGRLFDLCQTTQKKYNLAISIVFGKNMDAIVVDTQKVAIQCIKYMREQRSGEATFLPLDTIQAKSINEKYRSFAKGARLAIDVIQSEPIAEKALLYACGNALICDSMDVAKYICYERHQEVKAVTLEGTVIHKTGMITGGWSVNSDNGKRWEEKEIQDLKRSHDELTAQLIKIQKEKRKASHDDHIKSDILSLESRQTGLADELSAVNLRLATISTELENVCILINNKSLTHKAAVASASALYEQVQDADRKIMDVEQSVFADFCRKIHVANIREYEENQLQALQETAEHRLKLTTQHAKLESQLTFEQQRLSEFTARVGLLSETLQSDTVLLSEFQTKKDAILHQSAGLEAQCTLTDQGLCSAREDMEKHIGLVTGIKKEITELNKNHELVSKNMAAKEAEIERCIAEKILVLRRCKMENTQVPLEGRKMNDVTLEELDNWEADANVNSEKDPNQMDVDMQTSEDSSGAKYMTANRLHRIQVNYKSLIKMYREKSGDETEQEFLDQIKEMTAEIERIAPNVRSTDRLDDIETKFKETADEFERARLDAKEAKDRFQEIKTQRFELFHNAYLHIESVIDSIYKELTISTSFPVGGTAYLSLEDSEEPYLDGIKYHAMPPMKRFREMEQLSGGEKTVAALALLFAVHSVCPAPFFVLDEVDAALDNTNVAKVTNYIRNHASDTMQFVVISLKPTFYENAESLVGVYRDQDQCSSRVLTMDLSRFEE
ncbi:Structural maintenance of chromosomes protein 1 [Batrachochytrium dendrobatidis]